MAHQRHCEVPVLIVGAGPAGLTAAVALARQGVECLLVERRRDMSSLPRATAISTRSMELLRSWDLEEAIRAGGIDAEWLMWVCETLASVSAGAGLPSGFPTREQSALISPTAPACVPQDHLESVLLRDLRSRGAARVRFGTTVVGVDDRPDGVQALRDVGSGESQFVHARYLIAADGAHSTVRSALGIPMRGSDDLGGAVTALFRAPLWNLVGDYRYGLYDINHPEGAGVFLPAGRGDRWLYGVQRKPGRELADVTEETMTRRIRFGAGVATLQPRIERIGSFSFAAQLAQRFRCGSVFLVGDAAHRVTPRGGTGMNIATSPFMTGMTLAGSSAGCFAVGPRRNCWTPMRRSAGRWPSTTWHGRPTSTARSARPSRSCTSTSAAASRTSGCRPRPVRPPRSTCWGPG